MIFRLRHDTVGVGRVRMILLIQFIHPHLWFPSIDSVGVSIFLNSLAERKLNCEAQMFN